MCIDLYVETHCHMCDYISLQDYTVNLFIELLNYKDESTAAFTHLCLIVKDAKNRSEIGVPWEFLIDETNLHSSRVSFVDVRENISSKMHKN